MMNKLGLWVIGFSLLTPFTGGCGSCNRPLRESLWPQAGNGGPLGTEARGWERSGKGSGSMTDILQLWDGTKEDEQVVTFKKTFEPALDLSKYEMISFELRGEGVRRALKIALEDANGVVRMYGPFWADVTTWTAFDFMPVAATWKDARDKEFDVRKITSVTLIPEPKMGKVELRNFVRIGATRPLFGQWQAQSLDADGFVLVDGKRFFPIGLYSVLGANASSAELSLRGTGLANTPETWEKMFQTVHDSGFNTIQSYTVPQFCGATSEDRVKGVVAFLDLAQKTGLKVMTPLVTPAELAAMLKAVKTHPALLAYYLADEPISGGVSRTQLETGYEAIKRQDTVHPVVIVECSEPGFYVYRHAADIMAFDLYPVGLPGPAAISAVGWSIDAVHAAPKENGRPATWNVVQIHQLPGTGAERLPTEKEMRAMTMQSLAKDVRGLFFFAMGYPDGQPPYFMRVPTHWQAVKRVIANVNELNAYCLSSAKAVVAVDHSDVVAGGKWVKIDGKSYLDVVAVYPCQGKNVLPTVEVEFSRLPMTATHVTVLDENAAREFVPGLRRELPLTNGTFKDTFADNDVHVYRLGPLE